MQTVSGVVWTGDLSRRAPAQRHLRRAWAFVLLAALLAASRASTQSVSDENRLKAAIISKLPQFVEWPPAALDEHSTIDLCVADPNPFGPVLEELVAGESLTGRPLTVRHVASQDFDRCHVLYLPGALPSRTIPLERVARLPVLTISDASQFLDEGGIVQLRLQASRIRFEVSVTAADRASLRISPQLLRLALNVRGGQ